MDTSVIRIHLHEAETPDASLFFAWKNKQLSRDPLNFPESQAVCTPTESHEGDGGPPEASPELGPDGRRFLPKTVIRTSCFSVIEVDCSEKVHLGLSHNWINGNNKARRCLSREG